MAQLSSTIYLVEGPGEAWWQIVQTFVAYLQRAEQTDYQILLSTSNGYECLVVNVFYGADYHNYVYQLAQLRANRKLAPSVLMRMPGWWRTVYLTGPFAPGRDVQALVTSRLIVTRQACLDRWTDGTREATVTKTVVDGATGWTYRVDVTIVSVAPDLVVDVVPSTHRADTHTYFVVGGAPWLDAQAVQPVALSLSLDGIVQQLADIAAKDVEVQANLNGPVVHVGGRLITGGS